MNNLLIFNALSVSLSLSLKHTHTQLLVAIFEGISKGLLLYWLKTTPGKFHFPVSILYTFFRIRQSSHDRLVFYFILNICIKFLQIVTAKIPRCFLKRIQVVPFCLAGEVFLFDCDCGVQSFVWLIYSLICSASKGVSPRLPWMDHLQKREQWPLSNRAVVQK